MIFVLKDSLTTLDCFKESFFNFWDSLNSVILFEREFNIDFIKSINFCDTLLDAERVKLKILRIKAPSTSNLFIQEKLNERDAAGIRKITRNIKLPINPIIFERFVKISLPKDPPALFSK